MKGHSNSSNFFFAAPCRMKQGKQGKPNTNFNRKKKNHDCGINFGLIIRRVHFSSSVGRQWDTMACCSRPMRAPELAVRSALPRGRQHVSTQRQSHETWQRRTARCVTWAQQPRVGEQSRQGAKMVSTIHLYTGVESGVVAVAPESASLPRHGTRAGVTCQCANHQSGF